MKDVDVFFKIISLQCFSLRRLFDNNLHDWKIIPLFFKKKEVLKKFLNFIVMLTSLNVH